MLGREGLDDQRGNPKINSIINIIIDQKYKNTQSAIDISQITYSDIRGDRSKNISDVIAPGNN